MPTHLPKPSNAIRLLGLFTAATLVGCGGTDDPAPSSPNPSPPSDVPFAREIPTTSRPELPAPATLRERLDRRVALALDAAGSKIELTFARGDSAGDRSRASLGTWSGQASARSDASGGISIGALALEAGDLEIAPEDFPPDGIHLADLAAEVTVQELASEWAPDGASASFEGRASLRVSWSLVTGEGRKLPLRPLETSAVTVAGGVALNDGGRAAITVTGVAAGPLFRAGDLIDLSDLSFTLSLVEPAGER